MRTERSKLRDLVDTGIILNFTITDWKGSDAKEFKRLIRDLPRIRKTAGDKAYSSCVNCQAVADKGEKLFCFKANTTARRRYTRHGKYHSRCAYNIKRAKDLGIPLWVSCQ